MPRTHNFSASALPSQADATVNSCLPAVRFLANKLASRLSPNVEVDDLIQAGMIGLLQSIGRFNPIRGVKFTTFANQRIEGAMLDYLRSLDWKPRLVRERHRKMERASHDAEQRLGHTATRQELAEQIGISAEQIDHWLNCPMQFTCNNYEENPGNPVDCVAGSADSPERIVEKKEIRALVAHAIHCLPRNQRLVLGFYHYEELTMQEIADIMGVTQARVSQFYREALLRLRGKFVSV
jgi:RNA polymerase sigma factor FliA